MKSPLIALAGVIAACAILASSAQAHTYCVPKPICRSGEFDKTGVQDALTAAQKNPGEDTVRIGAGTFKSATGFDYIAGNNDNDVRVQGAGSGISGTILAADTVAKGDSFAVLDVDGGGASTRISGLRVLAPRAAAPGNVVTGLRLNDGIAEDLHVRDDGTLVQNARFGVDLEAAVLEDSSVMMNHADVTGAVRIGQDTRVTDVYASGGTGVTSRGLNAKVERTRIFSSLNGIYAPSGALSVHDTLLRATDGDWKALFVSSQDKATTHVAASHLTVVGTGLPSDVAVRAIANDGHVDVAVDNSIFHDTLTPIWRTGTPSWGAYVTTESSAYDKTKHLQSGPGTLAESSIVPDAPKFVGAAFGNYRLSPTSPLVDRGTNSPYVTTFADLAKSLRNRDGDLDGIDEPDLGAYEYQASAPLPAIQVLPAGPTAGQAVSLAGSATDPDSGDSYTCSWLIDGTQAGGCQIEWTFATAGQHAIVLTVTDSGGKTASKSLTLPVAAVPEAPGAVSSPVIAGGPADATAPRLTGLRACRHGRRARLRVASTEAVVLTLRLQRRRDGRWRTVRTLRPVDLMAGTWWLSLARAPQGALRVTATARDAAGNVSPPSRARIQRGC